MFTILGSDGKEYGPATAGQIRSWIVAGRANLDTKAKLVGTEDWRRLAEIPEIAGTAGPDLPHDADHADRGTRLLAKLLDEVCSLVCALPGGAIVGWSALRSMFGPGASGGLDDVQMTQSLLGLGVMALGVIALAIVQIWMITTRGQTIGKRVFGIRIALLRDGSKPGFVHGWLLRSFVPAVISVLPFGLGVVFSLVDACFIFRRDRRCVHDFIAGTWVMRVGPQDAP